MKTLLKKHAMVAAVVVGALLLGPSALSASSGEHWGPGYWNPSSGSWTDEHGQQVNTVVFGVTITSGASNVWHASTSLCAINGVPSYIEYGLFQLGSTWSVAGCSDGGVVIVGYPRTWF